MRFFAKTHLLVLDDWGLAPMTPSACRELLEDSHGRHSTIVTNQLPMIITTNLGFANWTQVFGDPKMTAALLDRLTHKVYIINCIWENYRLKQSLNQKVKRT